jgi:hypothetical protein
MIILREVVLSIYLQHDALAPREEEQEVHALTRERKAMTQGFYDSGVIVKIDLRQKRGQPLTEDGSIELEVGGEELALRV